MGLIFICKHVHALPSSCVDWTMTAALHIVYSMLEVALQLYTLQRQLHHWGALQEMKRWAG